MNPVTDARHLNLIKAAAVAIALCPVRRPDDCDPAANWNIRPRWHAIPHRKCILR